jgi:aryl-alcohol dehydrogenase-like predicted oxidoreductase
VEVNVVKPIAKLPFGNTGHMSTRVIFGSVCLKQADQHEADNVLELLLKYGINHIDTAPLYGDAELRLGPWMKHHRDRFFLATKTDQRTYQNAREQFFRSLDRLQVDRVDLLQMHNLTDVVYREIAMGPGGALEFLVEARDQGLTQFIGVTGHGILAPKMHLESLDRFAFDSVLLPCNYPLMQDPYYRDHFNRLISYCSEHNIAVQTIKSVARGLWGNKPRNHITWYEPITDEQSIAKFVHWVQAIAGIFLITVGDIQELPKFLEAAASYQSPPPDEKMKELVENQRVEPLFSNYLETKL